MLTSQEIEKAKRAIQITVERHHEHDDCIRIAYAWLDAQKKTVHANRRLFLPLKHLIENWAGRYVSQSDVEAAAFLHPDIIGAYPNYNISKRLTAPSVTRLDGVGQAFEQQGYCEQHDPSAYHWQEE